MSCHSTFKYLTSACFSGWSALQKPFTFLSSTCIDLTGWFKYVILDITYYISTICYMCSCRNPLHAQSSMCVDGLAVTRLGTCSAAADLFCQDQTLQHCPVAYITILNSQKAVMTELFFSLCHYRHCFFKFFFNFLVSFVIELLAFA